MKQLGLRDTCKIMVILALLLLLTSGFSSAAGSRNSTLCGLLVEPLGYACQEHDVTTEDGYILSLQRIPRGRSGKVATKPPVLLQHGLMMDGASWLVNPPNESLAFILADTGFDVWIANSRGTRFSRRSTTSTPNDPRFWEWSWDEMATYDLPALLGYVHNQTHQYVHYIGHSLGALTMITPLSENTLVVVEKLRAVVLLSPITYLEHMHPIVLNFSKTILSHERYWKHVHEFDPKSPRVAGLVKNIFSNSSSDLLNTLTGPNCCIHPDTLGKLYEYEPQSTSVKNMIHMAQMVGKSRIQMFDYGKEENMRRYYVSNPYEFDLFNLAWYVPLYVGWGGRDQLADGEELAHFLSDIDNHGVGLLETQKVEEYAHADFVLASNANELVYAPIITFLNKY